MEILYKIIQLIATISIYIICVIVCFFKPIFQSNQYNKQNQQVNKQCMADVHKEYNSLIDDIQLLKQKKKYYQQQVRTLREEIRWSNDRSLLQKWGKDVTQLDKYRQQLESEWNRALEDDSEDND